MTSEIVASDMAVVELLRKRPSLTVNELAAALQVTATAVRQRLNRLMGQGFIQRTTSREGRGRPRHYYELTAKGRRKAGSNLGDLAVALWKEVVAIEDPAVRRVLIQRVSTRLAEQYAWQVEGDSVGERMERLASLFKERRISFSVDTSNENPRLTAVSCPYPDLADGDRNICAMERQLLARVLGTRVRMRECRLDGDNCCSFEPDVATIDKPTSEVAAGG